MSNVAKVTKLKAGQIPEYIPPTTLRINLKKYPLSCDVGDKVSFSGKGVVKMIRKDSVGQDMEIEITGLKEGYSGEGKR